MRGLAVPRETIAFARRLKCGGLTCPGLAPSPAPARARRRSSARFGFRLNLRLASNLFDSLNLWGTTNKKDTLLGILFICSP